MMPNRPDGRNGLALVEIKSKFDAEFRRFAVDREKMVNFVEFYKLVCKLHKLAEGDPSITYSDRDGELLPLNNDSNLAHALNRACSQGSLLRVVVQRKGENIYSLNQGNKGNIPIIGKLMPPKSQTRPRVDIGQPVSFRPVSAIIDVDVVPATHLRVKLMKNGSDRPLGFYIRDGVSLRVNATGVEKVPGIFISRLVPGGLAQHTGLLSVGDEVLEVNGIDVGDKTLDQVTDMMIANASNLIITVKPANQQLTLAAGRRSSTALRTKANKSSSFRGGSLREMGTKANQQQRQQAVPPMAQDHSAQREQTDTNKVTEKSASNEGSKRSPPVVAVVREELENVGQVADSITDESEDDDDDVRVHDTGNDNITTNNNDVVSGDIVTVEHHQVQQNGVVDDPESESVTPISSLDNESDEENELASTNFGFQATDPGSRKTASKEVLRI